MFRRPNPVVRNAQALVSLLVLASWAALTISSASLMLRPWPDSVFRLDFVSFWTGASMIRSGQQSSLFDMDIQSDTQAQLRGELATSDEFRTASGHNPFHNPPPLGLLFLPLTFIPFFYAYIVTWGMSLLTIAVALVLPLRRAALGLLTATVLLTFPPVAATLVEGQLNALFLLALSLAMYALIGGRAISGGALLGILWLKPQYGVIYGLVLLWKRRWRELLGFGGAGVVIAAMSLAMVGVAGCMQYLQVLQRIGAYYPPTESLISPEKMSNWRGLLMALFPSLSSSDGSILVLALAGSTCVLVLLAWRGRWDATGPRFPRQMLVTTLGTLLASPHSHFHGTILLLAPLAYMYANPMENSPIGRWWWLPATICYAVAYVVFPLRTYSYLLVPCFVVVMSLLVWELRSSSDSPVIPCREVDAAPDISPAWNLRSEIAEPR